MHTSRVRLPFMKRSLTLIDKAFHPVRGSRRPHRKRAPCTCTPYQAHQTRTPLRTQKSPRKLWCPSAMRSFQTSSTHCRPTILTAPPPAAHLPLLPLPATLSLSCRGTHGASVLTSRSVQALGPGRAWVKHPKAVDAPRSGTQSNPKVNHHRA